MKPASSREARELLAQLGAPPRLLRHVELVGEAAEAILHAFRPLGVPVHEQFVRVGVVLHDAGKIIHRHELDAPGAQHEPDGEALLLAHAVTPELARVCRSHAQWRTMRPLFEELVVALADKLWKGTRVPELEERVIDEAAAALHTTRWEIFVALDGAFEAIAAAGDARLARSHA